MRARVLWSFLAAVVACMHASGVAASDLRVLYAEPLSIQGVDAAGAGVRKAGAGAARIQAFGKTFELDLHDNSRLLSGMSPSARARLGEIRVYGGAVKGAPGSWVRLTETAGLYSGAMWDGVELYAVEPQENIQDLLLTPLAERQTGSTIFRLSDTQGGALTRSCGLDPRAAQSVAPLAAFRSLMREIQSAPLAVPLAAAREIEIALLADSAYTSLHGAGALTRMLSHMNVVDGIFSTQLNVSTVPTDFVTFTPSSDPFTTNDAPALLNQLAVYRGNTPAMRSRGLSHLLTGRNLVGQVIGIAYLGTLCGEFDGVSLSEGSLTYDTALIIAHELGHNFGAPHDGESGSACASTPQSFLMAPQLNSSTQFSSCSVQQMQPHIAAASCVVAARNRDVAVSVPAPTIDTVIGEPVTYVADLASVGTAAATSITATVFTPFGLQVTSASLPGGTCSVGSPGAGVVCQLAELPPGSSQRLTLILQPGSAGEMNVRTVVSAVNDVNETNNESIVRVRVAAARDVRVTVDPATIDAISGAPFEATFDVESIGSQTLVDASAQLQFYGGEFISVSVDSGTCTVGVVRSEATCALGALPVRAVRRISARMTTTAIGDIGGRIFVFNQNNFLRTADFRVNTRAARDIALSMTPSLRRVAIGADAIWTIEARSQGVEDVEGVQVLVRASELLQLTVDGGPGANCVRAGQTTTCDVGDMAAGAVRTLQVRASMDREFSTGLSAEVVLPAPDNLPSNDRANVSLEVRVGQEIQLEPSPGTSGAFDGRVGYYGGSILAAGANAVEDVDLAITLPPGFRFAAVTLDKPCSLADVHIAICRVARLEGGHRLFFNYSYHAPQTPGVYTASVVVRASNDTDPSNNSRQITYTIAPSVDGSLSVVGVTRAQPGVPVDLVFTAAANRYALPDARLQLTWYGPLANISATAPGAACAMGEFSSYFCTLGTIPPGGSVPISVRVLGDSPSDLQISGHLLSPAETESLNNSVTTTVPILRPGDMTVDLPQPTLTVTDARATELPIDLNVLSDVHLAYLELQFDPQRVGAPSIQGLGCNWGAQPVRCEIEFPQVGVRRLNLVFGAHGVGNTEIRIRVGARNDFNAANDERVATIVVQEAPPPPAPPPASPPASGRSGGGGGGGSMDWVLGALALLWWAQLKPARLRRLTTPRIAHSRP